MVEKGGIRGQEKGRRYQKGRRGQSVSDGKERIIDVVAREKVMARERLISG